MLEIPRFKGEHDLYSVDPELQPHAMVLDIQNVEPEARDGFRQSGKLSRMIADDDPEDEVTPGCRETMLDELDQKDRIDVSARQHGKSRPIAGHDTRQD